MSTLPITLVLISATLSGLYKISYQIQLTGKQRRTVTYTHAFAIEGIQLLLLLSAIIIQYFHVLAFRSGDDFACYGLVAPSCIAIPLNIAIYSFALIAVDVIDNKIQSGCWRHPLQCQTLILTRSALMPWTVRRREQHHQRSLVGLCPTHDGKPTSPLRSAGSLWSTIYLTPATSPASAASPRTHRSCSEPSTPMRILWSTRRRDSTPESGSVSRLVSTFEGESRTVDRNFHSPDMDEVLRQSNLSTPTRPPTPDKQSIDISSSETKQISLQASTPSKDSIVEGVSEASALFPTPETTPDKTPSVTQSELPKIRPQEDKASKVKPSSQRSTKKTAQHTAHRAQVRKSRGKPSGRVE